MDSSAELGSFHACSMSWIYLNVIIVCTVCIKSTQCVQVCNSVHTRFRCAQSTLLSTPDAEIRSKYAQYATSVHTRLKKCALGVHRCAQYSQSWSGIFSRRISPTIEHTMCVLDTLLSNFVCTFFTVCTLCANQCVPARTVCKCVRSKHNVYIKRTFLVRG